MGTAIKGSGEGLHLQPQKARAKILAPFVELIKSIFDDGYMSEQSLEKLAGSAYLSKSMLFLFKLLAPTGVIQIYWDQQLKQNNAYKHRNDRPFEVREGLNPQTR